MSLYLTSTSIDHRQFGESDIVTDADPDSSKVCLGRRGFDSSGILCEVRLRVMERTCVEVADSLSARECFALLCADGQQAA